MLSVGAGEIHRMDNRFGHLSQLLAPCLTALLVTACSGGPGGPTAGDQGTSGSDASAPAVGSDGGGTTSTPPSGDAGAPPVTGADAGPTTGGPSDAGYTAPSDGSAPPDFWDAGTIPVATNVMTFVFLNRTNGTYADADVYWSFINGSISETHSIAAQPTYDMPANASGRMYFYLCAAGDAACAAAPTKSLYFDFIEFTIGATQFNGNTTRVDAFGLKIAMRMHCADGFDVAVGEDYETFAEDRTATFQKFIAAAPAEFQPLAQAPHAPYRIVEPGAGGFNAGDPNADYYNSYESAIWSANGITLPLPGANGSGLGANPDLSAAIFRHVGAVAGTFDATGKLLNQNLWKDPTTFYTAAPADYYAKFWHDHALNGKAYGFPYDDVGGYSSYISHSNPQSMLVAIGW